MPSIGTQSNSITNLKATVLESGKLHNPNKFHAEVSGPQGEMINPYVTDVVLPGRGVKTQQEFLWGLERNVPIGRSYSNDDFLITFALRETFYERSFFENWIRYHGRRQFARCNFKWCLSSFPRPWKRRNYCSSW